MAAWMYILCSVLAIGLWASSSVTEARRLPSIDYDNLALEEQDPQEVASLHRYLRNVGDYLTDETERINDMAADKRLNPSSFYGVRGKRDEDKEEERQHLIDLIRYFHKLNSKRTKEGISDLDKRQPPSGFHAVRGKRSLHSKHISPFQPLM